MTRLVAAAQNWLFRWHNDGSTPIVLTQRRIFILPTGAGVLYALALTVMLVGAINYNLALGHALVFLLGSLGLVGMVHAFRNLAGLVVHGGRPEPVFAGEVAHFPLFLGNDRQQPRLALEFRAGTNCTVRADLPPRHQGRVELPVTTQRRGWLALPRVRLSTRYPLGLFEAWSYPQPDLRCLVYPQPEPFPLPPPGAAASGSRYGDSGQEDFAGLRQRQPADSPRHVAWKAVARNAPHLPLLVKQFAGGSQDERWLDWSALPATSLDERGISILTGWVLAADGAALRYGLRLPGLTLDPDCGDDHRRRCLEALALAPLP